MCDVLILDDDAFLVELMADTLRDEGLDVLTVGDTETALDTLREPGAKVLVADKWIEIGSTHEDGHSMAEVAERLYPTLRVVFISGDHDALGDRILTPRERLLPKPFIANELVVAVQEVLA